MLFDFHKFLSDLREHDEKKVIIEKYEKMFWPITWDLTDQSWFKDYVSTFPTLPYAVTPELKEDFDWNLLMQLVSSSFSSEWFLEQSNNGADPEFVISVKSGDQLVVKKISELWWFQVLRLYSIYIEEQMNLAILSKEDDQELVAITSQREQRKNRRLLVLDNWTSVQAKILYENEKADKLWDLMNQL
jgi:hypothetical protein